MADKGPGKNDEPLDRNGRHGYSGSLAVLTMLVILDLAWAGLTVAAEKLDKSAPSASSSLFKRQPLGFDHHTIDRIAAAFRNLPSEVPKLIEFARGQHRVLGHGGGVLMLLLAVAIGYGIYGRVQLQHRIKQAFAPLFARIPSAGQQWPAAISEVGAVTLLPISLWGLWTFVRALTDFHGPLFTIAGQLLLAWTVSSFALSAVRDLVMRPLL